METDLFGSDSLFTSFETKAPDASDEDEPNNSVTGNRNSPAAASSSLTDAALGDADLIVLDETGSSSGDEAAVSGDKPTRRRSDSDIEILDGSAVAGSASDVEEIEEGEGQGSDQVDSAGCECESCPFKKGLLKTIYENKKLTEKLQALKRRKCIRVTCKNSVTVEVGFSDESYIEKFRDKIKKFVSKLFDGSNLSDVQNACNGDASFCEDKSGVAEDSDTEDNSGAWRLPTYKLEFSDVLEEDGAAKPEKDQKLCGPSAAKCFNCLGEHVLSNCPLPKDHGKIAANRRTFMSNCTRQTRYHEEEDSKFSKFRPGVISDSLRKALNYGPGELPNFIYKMRRLGYPPGWLQEAEVSSSGLILYDSNGKEIAKNVDSGDGVDNAEDGEVVEIGGEVRVQYNPALLMEYPGFNVMPPHGTIDNWRKFGYPPMMEHNMKSHVAKFMKAPEAQPYKRKKTSSLPTLTKRPKVDHIEVDMELEDEEEAIRPPGVQNVIDDDDDDDDCQIVPPIAEEPSHLTDTTPPTSPTHKNGSTGSDVVEMPEVPADAIADSVPSTSAATPLVAPATPVAVLRSSMSKSVTLGSPSIITDSKGKGNLPAPDKFAIGVSEHIPFENLPDAVGSYEKMKDTIQKIRKFVVESSK